MAQRFNRAMEIMGWRVPVSEADFDEPMVEEEEVREFTMQSVPGGAAAEPAFSQPRTERSFGGPSERSAASGSSLRRIATVHPESYADARQIGESFRSGVPVIMNLSDLPDSEARRVVDFAAGLVFGLQGSIERVTSRVFLLSPKNIEVSSAGRSDSKPLFH